MRLFDVQANHRVRVTSNRISYKINEVEEYEWGTNVVWEGTTTDAYRECWGAMRRLIADQDVDFWDGEGGVWSRDLECEDLGPVESGAQVWTD